MIDINIIRENPDKVRQALANKRLKPDLVDQFLEIDKKWRTVVTALDQLRAEKNTLTKDDIERAKVLKEKGKQLEEDQRVLEKERDILVEQFPNIPSDDTPVGKDDAENVLVREFGQKPQFDFTPKDYLALADGLINIESATKIAGSRFGYILGDLAILEFALLKLCYDKLIPQGFVPIVPPVMVKPEVMKGMGKIKFLEGDDAFYLPKDDLVLVGSSEHSIGPMYMDQILDTSKLPLRYLGFSTCFRREAGSYGKDTKGILRVHQFDKIEMFSFTKKEDSPKEHEFFLAKQEELMQALNLHYRVMSICTGDMGFGDHKQYDIETWLPGQPGSEGQLGRYRETQSTSNTTDYQSRGLNIKYRVNKDGKPATEFVHTLNGTAFAIGRILIAIIENYQTKHGTIIVPEVLRAYVGKEEIKPAV